MSAEKIISQEVNDLPPLATPEKSEEVSSSGRVDINILLNRARKVKEKETISNLSFYRVNTLSYFLLLVLFYLFNYIFPYFGPPLPSGVTQVMF